MISIPPCTRALSGWYHCSSSLRTKPRSKPQLDGSGAPSTSNSSDQTRCQPPVSAPPASGAACPPVPARPPPVPIAPPAPARPPVPTAPPVPLAVFVPPVPSPPAPPVPPAYAPPVPSPCPLDRPVQPATAIARRQAGASKERASGAHASRRRFEGFGVIATSRPIVPADGPTVDHAPRPRASSPGFSFYLLQLARADAQQVQD